jgi:hypothetical protein
MLVVLQLLLGSGASLVPLLLLLLLLLPIGRSDHQIMPDAFNAGPSTATAKTRNSYSLCGAAVVDSATSTQLMLLCCGWWQPAQLILLSCGWWQPAWRSESLSHNTAIIFAVIMAMCFGILCMYGKLVLSWAAQHAASSVVWMLWQSCCCCVLFLMMIGFCRDICRIMSAYLVQA